MLDHIRAHGHDSETLNVLYVIDERGVLIDDIRVRELLLVPVTASDVRPHEPAIRGPARDRQRARRPSRCSGAKIARRCPSSIEDGVLIGIVTVDDVLDAAQEMATRDLQRFGGSEVLGEPYMAVPVARMIRKRAGWLVVLFLGELLTATAMGFFEDEIARAVVLALFVPLIISSGGNSGSQAATLVIRALALGEVSLARLVAGGSTGDRLRADARRDPGPIGFVADCRLVALHGPLRPALAAGRHHRRRGARRRRAVGIAGRVDAAVRAPARWASIRPRRRRRSSRRWWT